MFSIVNMGGDQIIIGDEATKYLNELEYITKKIFIVHNGIFTKKDDIVPKIINNYKEMDFQTAEFHDIEPEPSFDTIKAGAKKMIDFSPEWIIAVGGGSVMDAAKAMWIMYEHPNLDSLDKIKPPLPTLRKKAKLICLPTTSGTGSEVTLTTVITDKHTSTKNIITDKELIPDIAILAPELTSSMPKNVTASTGMDALTHAIEAKVSTKSNEFSNLFADQAIQYIYNNILKAYDSPDDLKARKEMLIGSTLAGLSFSSVSLGIVHSISHAIGGQFNLPHGLTNAIVLPYVIKFNSKDSDTKDIYTEIANTLKLKTSLQEEIQKLNNNLGIEHKLQDIIKDDDKFEEIIDQLVEIAKTERTTPTNPVQPTDEEFKKLIIECYYG